jgi:hypothetical protein
MAACFEMLLQQLQQACQADDHAAALVSLSLSLGLIETALTSKTSSVTTLSPESLQVRQEAGTTAFLMAVCRADSHADCRVSGFQLLPMPG